MKLLFESHRKVKSTRLHCNFSPSPNGEQQPKCITFVGDYVVLFVLKLLTDVAA